MNLSNIASSRTDSLSSLHGINYPYKHDRNDFYYKPNRPTEPTDSFSLECRQWRHKTEPHSFKGFICFELIKEKINGTIECEVHAENLSEPIRSILPVCILSKKADVETVARDMIHSLQASSTETLP